MPLTPGEMLGPYEIRSRIAAGGMGEVYQAFDTRLRRSVAVKVVADAVTSPAVFITRRTAAASPSTSRRTTIATLPHVTGKISYVFQD